MITIPAAAATVTDADAAAHREGRPLGLAMGCDGILKTEKESDPDRSQRVEWRTSRQSDRLQKGEAGFRDMDIHISGFFFVQILPCQLEPHMATMMDHDCSDCPKRRFWYQPNATPPSSIAAPQSSALRSVSNSI